MPGRGGEALIVAPAVRVPSSAADDVMDFDCLGTSDVDAHLRREEGAMTIDTTGNVWAAAPS